MDPEKIGVFIRDVRKENGLTQEQLAEKLGVSQRSISRWETGKTMPDYSLLPSICEALEINMAELLSAERIEGDSVSKLQVTAMAHNMISIMNDNKNIRRIIGAVISAVIMLTCAVGLYCYEFNVSVESTVDLERAINAYHFLNDVSADVFERQVIGNHLYVLYGNNNYPGACGLACLEKGIFGHYKIIGCEDTGSRWVNVSKITERRKEYCVTYCANILPEIDSYGVLGVKGQNLTEEDSTLIYKLDYSGSPFLTATEIEDGVSISPFRVKYYRNNVEIQDDELESVLGIHFVDGAPNSGTAIVGSGLFYVLEVIILLLGMVVLRYFLSDVIGKRKR